MSTPDKNYITADNCPSTHCNRSQECRSPSECSSSVIGVSTWGGQFWRWVRKGHDRSDAAFRADAWEARMRQS